MSLGQQNLKSFSLSLSEEVISYLQAEALKAGVTTGALAAAVLTQYLKGSVDIDITSFPVSGTELGEANAS